MLMSADEARKTSENNFTPRVIRELQEIEVLISAACMCGDTCCWYFDRLLPQTISKLKSKGYTVQDNSSSKERRHETLIMW